MSLEDAASKLRVYGLTISSFSGYADSVKGWGRFTVHGRPRKTASKSERFIFRKKSKQISTNWQETFSWFIKKLIKIPLWCYDEKDHDNWQVTSVTNISSLKKIHLKTGRKFVRAFVFDELLTLFYSAIITVGSRMHSRHKSIFKLHPNPIVENGCPIRTTDTMNSNYLFSLTSMKFTLLYIRCIPFIQGYDHFCFKAFPVIFALGSFF